MTSKSIRILLSEAASKALREAGSDAFAVISPASGEDAPRMVIHAVPIEWQTARDAVAVLMGKTNARHFKKP